MQASDVKRIAVMGLGKMGVDWVANLLEGGYEVVGFMPSEKFAEHVRTAFAR